MWKVSGLFFLVLVSFGTAQNVIVPPTITTQPKPLAIYQSSSGSQITLYCKASGTPSPSISWKQIKGTVVQDVSVLNSVDVVDGNLVFTNLREANIPAKYQCFAENSGGKTFSSYAEVKEAIIPAIPGGVDVQTRTVNAGDSLELPCVVPEGTFPPPELYWALAKKTNDGSTTVSTTDSRISITETGSLLFAYVIPSDAKGGDEPDGSIYVCRVRNADTNTIRETTKIQLNVIGTDSTSKPPALLYSTASPVVALVGKKARMMCFFGGRPVPDITWEHNGRTVLGSDRISFSGFNQIIDITDVLDSDEEDGPWICSAKDVNANTKPNIKLDVQSVPTLTRQPVNTNVSVGNDHMFYCDAHGEPTPKVQFYINGEPVTGSTSEYTLSVNTGGSPQGTIQFKAVKKPDSIVVVQCMATNDHGDKIVAGYLNVLEPLVIIKEPAPNYSIDLPGKPNTNITISCMARIDSSDQIKAEWSQNGYLLDYANNPGFKLVDDGQTLHIDVTSDKDKDDKSLKATYSGTFKCKIEAVYNGNIRGFETQERTAKVVFSGDADEVADPVAAGVWWIALIVAGVVLLVVIILVICLIQRNREVAYRVGEKEVKAGHDPERELADSGFQDYARPSEDPMKGSRASLGEVSDKPLESDEDSLKEYGDIDTGKFNEDGSFIGQYGESGKKRPSDSIV